MSKEQYKHQQDIAFGLLLNAMPQADRQEFERLNNLCIADYKNGNFNQMGNPKSLTTEDALKLNNLVISAFQSLNDNDAATVINAFANDLLNTFLALGQRQAEQAIEQLNTDINTSKAQLAQINTPTTALGKMAAAARNEADAAKNELALSKTNNELDPGHFFRQVINESPVSFGPLTVGLLQPILTSSVTFEQLGMKVKSGFLDLKAGFLEKLDKTVTGIKSKLGISEDAANKQAPLELVQNLTNLSKTYETLVELNNKFETSLSQFQGQYLQQEPIIDQNPNVFQPIPTSQQPPVPRAPTPGELSGGNSAEVNNTDTNETEKNLAKTKLQPQQEIQIPAPDFKEPASVANNIASNIAEQQPDIPEPDFKAPFEPSVLYEIPVPGQGSVTLPDNLPPVPTEYQRVESVPSFDESLFQSATTATSLNKDMQYSGPSNQINSPTTMAVDPAKLQQNISPDTSVSGPG